MLDHPEGPESGTRQGGGTDGSAAGPFGNREREPEGRERPEGDATPADLDLPSDDTPATPPSESGPDGQPPFWDKAIPAAQIVISLAVVSTLALVVLSSMRTAERLASLTASVESLTTRLARVDEPELQVTGIYWIRGNAPVTCGEYPTGIRIELTNVSLVPVRKYPAQASFFYGDSLLTTGSLSAGTDSADEPLVIAPGQRVVLEQFVPGMSPAIDARQGRLSGPPHFNFTLRVPVFGLASSEMRDWSGTYVLRSFDCETPARISWDVGA